MNVMEELHKATVDVAFLKLSALAQLIALRDEELMARLADPEELLEVMTALHYTRHAVYHILTDEQREAFDKTVRENGAAVADQIINTIEKVLGKKQ